MFTNLQYLSFGPSSTWYQRFSFYMPFPTVVAPTVTSSNLLELHISVNYFTDLLYLLDGRFNQLHTLNVFICLIDWSRSTINNEVDCF